MENCRMLRKRDFANIFFACIVNFSSKSGYFGAKNVERWERPGVGQAQSEILKSFVLLAAMPR